MKWILFEYLPFQPSPLCFSWLVLKNYTIACIHFKQVHTVVAFLTENQVPDSLLLNLGDMYFMYTLYTVLYTQFAVCMIYTMWISCTIVLSNILVHCTPLYCMSVCVLVPHVLSYHGGYSGVTRVLQITNPNNPNLRYNTQYLDILLYCTPTRCIWLA